ncbi:MAG: Ig-like domain-containing protein [Ruminococcus sp.]|nr:Ig-like domain-containing protein [Ruminococcus sp.]
MARLTKRITSYLLIIALVFTMTATLSVTDIRAAGFPTGYPNTYTNTGSGATDIVGVARTQVGYQENSVGTKYGDWYNGIFVNQPWCAMFVSWCAEQANIPNTVIQKYASCSVEVAWFKAIGRWYDSKAYGGSYTPQKGDIVFYRDSGSSSVSTHTGVLAGLNGNYLDVIEGNATNGKVCEYTANASRTLSASYVIGYGNPDYSEEMTDEPDDHEKWQVKADSLKVRASASTSASKLTTVPFGTVIQVTQFKLAGGYLWGYTTYSKKSGWVALDYCEYVCGSINGNYYQLPPTVSPTKKTLYVGKTKKLTVTNGLGVTFSSSDTAVATVNKNGKITAVKAGTATVSAKTLTGTATCKVTVEEPYISDEKATTCIGDKITLTVTGVDNVTWKSSDKTIAKVSSAGKVTGVSVGVAEITATSGTMTFTCEVTVTEFPTTYENFTVAKDETYLFDKYQGTTKLATIPKGTDIKVDRVEYSDTYTWGHTTYKSKEGWVILNRCTYKNGTLGNTAYTVRPYLNKSAKKMYLKDKFTLAVKSGKGTWTFKSSNKNIASVNSAGVVTARKKGTATITAKNDTYTLTCKVTVLNPTVSKSELVLALGKTYTLTVKGGTGKIKWSSSKKNVAAIKDGVVTAKKVGKTKIVAQRNGKKSKCVVTVVNPVLNATSTSLKIGQKKTLKVIRSSGAAIKWKSSKPSVVKVNQKGVIKGKKAGAAKVVAKVDGVKLACIVKVK